MRAIVMAVLAAWCVGAAQADALTKADMAQLAKGEAVVRVSPDPNSKSVSSGRAFAAIDVPAPPQDVFAVLIDCKRLMKIAKRMTACKARKRDPSGAWEERETEVTPSQFLPAFRAVARLDYKPPTQIKFRQIEGNFDYADGQWDLVAFKNGAATRLFYVARAGTSVPVPSYVVQSMIESEIPEMLKALRAEALLGSR